MDPLDHPDIHLLGERLGRQLDDILEAEQFAARVSAQRRTTLRDHLIRSEDMGLEVSVTTVGPTIVGEIQAVGIDHVVVVAETAPLVVGGAGVPQSRGLQVGAESVQLPSASQIRLAEPAIS